MRKALKKLGWVGAALLVANEIRGLFVVAGLISSGAIEALVRGMVG